MQNSIERLHTRIRFLEAELATLKIERTATTATDKKIIQLIEQNAVLRAANLKKRERKKSRPKPPAHGTMNQLRKWYPGSFPIKKPPPPRSPVAPLDDMEREKKSA